MTPQPVVPEMTAHPCRPFALTLFTDPVEMPVGTLMPQVRFDPVLQVSVGPDGTPRASEGFDRSTTCGGMTSGSEIEMMDLW